MPSMALAGSRGTNLMRPGPGVDRYQKATCRTVAAPSRNQVLAPAGPKSAAKSQRTRLRASPRFTLLSQLFLVYRVRLVPDATSGLDAVVDGVVVLQRPAAFALDDAVDLGARDDLVDE